MEDFVLLLIPVTNDDFLTALEKRLWPSRGLHIKHTCDNYSVTVYADSVQYVQQH